MSNVPTTPDSERRSMPTWLKATLSVFGVLLVLGLIFGKTPEEKQGEPVAAPPSSPATTTTTTPPPAEFVVQEVTGADVVVLSGEAVSRTVRVLGIEAPPSDGSGCFGSEAIAWAKDLLDGESVTLAAATSTVDEAGRTLAYLTLSDGSDYSTAALEAGAVKYLADGVAATTATALEAAEDVARQAGTGLWGKPCEGTIDAPPPPPTTVRPPRQEVTVPDPVETRKPEPQPKPQPEPEPAPEPEPQSAYYKNCDAARAAGAAPLYRGDPGYRSGLDRDDDGRACE